MSVISSHHRDVMDANSAAIVLWAYSLRIDMRRSSPPAHVLQATRSLGERFSTRREQDFPRIVFAAHPKQCEKLSKREGDPMITMLPSPSVEDPKPDQPPPDIHPPARPVPGTPKPGDPPEGPPRPGDPPPPGPKPNPPTPMPPKG
ncbi:MAG: hypothetical protein EA424_09425 [Planctomycetaceae bacterium]|nr:MAG: hypothetical protein EA424_09425 [Planctomycetaceae bacterium]